MKSLPALTRNHPLLIASLIGLLVQFTPALAADSVPQELQGLRAMTTWQVSDSTGSATPGQACGIGNLHRYARVRMDHEVGSNISDPSATRQMELLDRRVTGYLKQRGWSRMDVGTNGREIPNLKRCYRKQKVIVQVFLTTGRCPTNTPCNAYDGFAVTIYLPRSR